MDMSLSEEQDAFRSLARDFLEQGGRAAPHRVGPRRVGGPRDHPEDGRDRLLRADHPRGVRRPRRRLRHLLPRHGGARPRRLRAARHRVGLERAWSASRSSAYGTEEQKQQWLPGIATGDAARLLRAHRAGHRLRRRQPDRPAPCATATTTSSTARRCSSPTAPGPTSPWSSPAPAATGRGACPRSSCPPTRPASRPARSRASSGCAARPPPSCSSTTSGCPSRRGSATRARGSRSRWHSLDKGRVSVAAGCVGHRPGLPGGGRSATRGSARSSAGRSRRFQLVQDMIADISRRRRRRPAARPGGPPT